MNILIRSLLIICSIIGSSIISAEEGNSIQKDMVYELDNLKYNLTLKYGPLEWKKQHLDWDLEQTFDQFKSRIYADNIRDINAFKKIFKESLSSLKDYHVQIQFFSTEFSFFPFQIDGTEGRYFLISKLSFDDLDFEDDDFMCDAIPDMDKYAEVLANIQVGDELIALNGTPIQDLIEQIIDRELGGDRTPTGYGLAKQMLFHAESSYGQKSQSGLFTVTMRHQGDDETFTAELPWFHVKEWIKEPVAKGIMASDKSKATKSLKTLFAKDFSVALAKDFISFEASKMHSNKKSKKTVGRPQLQSTDEEQEGSDNEDEDSDDEENRDSREKGSLPPLGKVIWETNPHSHFYGYIYENEKNERIGYLYISSFAFPFIEPIVGIIEYFNSNTQALVLDITNNPGGDCFFTYGVLSLLTDVPLKTFTQRETLIQEDIYTAALIYNALTSDELSDDSLGSYHFDEAQRQRMSSHQELIMDLWQSGIRVTPPLPIFGIDEVLPHPTVRYTKPLLVLINELDFSCADLFPAILKDNGRATLFGKKTAGAGGYVRPYPHLSRFGIAGYSLTGSLLYRLDGTPIENLGVKPDIDYELTLRDFLENRIDYIQAVNKAVDGIMIH